ncbi:MAG: 1-acyl-sn-glycerol-3-phosphate acyltransferase [Firmicutes bacterium]|nr:1-acyl-sn-glycerol-3-phosphate acyltransferase [Bacillota bacterium]
MMNSKAPLLYKISRVVLGPIFKWYYNPTIVNKEYIPKKGSIVIAGNHKHLFDQCLTIIATKRPIHYMAKKEYFDDKKVAWFFKGTGCISVDRKNKDPKAKQAALDVLNDNGAIGIFPEGTRNRTDAILLPFKFGAVSLAEKTDSYIVPFAITGDYKFRSKNLKITYGKPFKINGMSLEEANDKLYKTVEKLLKQNAR